MGQRERPILDGRVSGAIKGRTWTVQQLCFLSRDIEQVYNWCSIADGFFGLVRSKGPQQILQ